MAVPNNTITTHHVGEHQEEFKAGIRSEDFPHIANLLINLYSDPIEAVVREYSTNALDAHIAAGIDRPIEVTLPTRENPELVIQDFGIGLNVDDLRDIYSMYGRSTKRDTNDAVGQLGLGCKSGLTYCDAFTITAVKDGVKVVAMSTKDEHGVGTIKVIDTVGTTDLNGVRIAIPVKSHDVYDFAHAAENLFQFWDEGTVLVNGEAPEVPEWRKIGLYLDADTIVLPPHQGGLYSSYVIMGNVAYQIPDITVKGQGRQRDYTRRVVARINMGDVDFVPSREAIHNTHHTEATLSELSDYVNDRFHVILDNKLANVATRWEATQLRTLWKGSGAGLNASQAMPIWAYTPQMSGRQARAHTGYSFDKLTKTSVVAVTRFPNKSLSPVHRRKLTEVCPDARMFVVIPTGVDASALNGRDNTFTWDEIEAKTTVTDDKGRKVRVKRDETKYTVLGHDPMVAADIAKLAAKKGVPVLLLDPKDSTRYGDLGCLIVQMFSTAQEDRLKRLIPGARRYNSEANEQREAAAKALTDHDRAVYHAGRIDRLWESFTPSEIDDPIISKAIALQSEKRSARLDNALNLGVSVTEPVDVMVGDRLSTYIRENYPLVTEMRYYRVSGSKSDDVALYVNAKYATIKAAAESEESLDSVAS